jgi:hypothetical protein
MILALTAALCMWLGASGLWAQTGAEGAAQSYVVQKGDTAKSIAKRFYGKSSLGGKLWAANRQLVDHPKRLTPGDTLFIFPEAALKAGQVAAVPPPLPGRPVELYDRGRPLNISFPKYFTFLADGRGLGESGSIRMKVKKDVPVPDSEDGSYVTEESLFEVRQVGAIIASNEHPGLVYGDGADKAAYWGKVNLSTNDEVMVYFTEDVAKILDGDTYGDSDPYFREFPIYGKSYTSRQPIDNRPDKGKSMGELYRFKGKVTIVARVEGTAPMTPRNSKALKKKGRAAGQDTEPVTYVGRITYAVDAVELDDEVFLFIPLNPGPERVLDPPFVEPPDSYTSLGN